MSKGALVSVILKYKAGTASALVFMHSLLQQSPMQVVRKQVYVSALYDIAVSSLMYVWYRCAKIMIILLE